MTCIPNTYLSRKSRKAIVGAGNAIRSEIPSRDEALRQIRDKLKTNDELNAPKATQEE